MAKKISIVLIIIGLGIIGYSAYDISAYKGLPIPDRIRTQFSIGIGLIVISAMLLQVYYKKKNKRTS